MEVSERLLEYLREPEVQKHLATDDLLGVYVGLMYTRFAYLGSQLTELLYAAGIDPLQSMKVIPLNFLDCSVCELPMTKVNSFLSHRRVKMVSLVGALNVVIG